MTNPDRDTLILFGDGLLHSGGFGDGDNLVEWWWDVFDTDLEKSFNIDAHDVLYGLVIEYLLPKFVEVGRKVDIYRIYTNHNPVRAERLDGVLVDNLPKGYELEDSLAVEVSTAQVGAIIDKLKMGHVYPTRIES